ncbi:hypothetical protein V501_01200 [Pseudogymnoascus sp. VKM F-4519 (FW-2642)]|nr:hypothetical protein V501_01200 [Pseudogymnoascus sp. VKM F-4519 (FW-2642)]
MNRDIIAPPRAPALAHEPRSLGLSVAAKAGGPEPVHVLDGAAGLLGHDDAVGAVGGGGGEGGAIGDGEVEARGVGGKEEGYGVELAGGGVGVGREAELAVAGDVDGDLEDFWWGVSRVVLSPCAVAASISAAAAAERVEGINIATQKLHARQLKPLRREQCTTITTVKEQEMEMPAKSGTTRGGMVNSAMTMSKLPSFSDPGLEGVVHVMQ